MAVKKKNTKSISKNHQKKPPAPKNMKKNKTSSNKNIKTSAPKKTALKNKTQRVSDKDKPVKKKSKSIGKNIQTTSAKKSTTAQSKIKTSSGSKNIKKQTIHSSPSKIKKTLPNNNKKSPSSSKKNTAKNKPVVSDKNIKTVNKTTPSKESIKKTSRTSKKNIQTHNQNRTNNTLPQSNKENVKISKHKTSQQEQITLEKVYEVTNEDNFLPKSVKTPEKTTFSDSLNQDINSVYSRTSDDIPEPTGKFTMEFLCKASPELLYKFLTDPIELSEWFCDDVNIRNGIYTFVWNGVPQQARLVKQERNSLVRFQWIEKNDGSYFEFNISKNNITGDVLLNVTDFSPPEELESNKIWWTNKINELKHILGLQY